MSPSMRGGVRIMTNARGIDVSRWQTTTPALEGLSFLFARATYGTTRDEAYAGHIAHARAAGLVTGAYHFGRRGGPAEQAGAFLAAAGDVDLYALDLESDGAGPSMTLEEARVFMTAVRQAGHQVGLYHSLAGYPALLGQDWAWVAAWRSSPPDIPWRFWQTRGSPLDLDQYHGSPAALLAWVGRPTYHVQIGRLATIRRYPLDRRGCITGWTDERWGPRPSSAPCSPPVHRRTCDGRSSATTVTVSAGRLAGQTIRVGRGRVVAREDS